MAARFASADFVADVHVELSASASGGEGKGTARVKLIDFNPCVSDTTRNAPPPIHPRGRRARARRCGPAFSGPQIDVQRGPSIGESADETPPRRRAWGGPLLSTSLVARCASAAPLVTSLCWRRSRLRPCDWDPSVVDCARAAVCDPSLASSLSTDSRFARNRARLIAARTGGAARRTRSCSPGTRRPSRPPPSSATTLTVSAAATAPSATRTTTWAR